MSVGVVSFGKKSAADGVATVCAFELGLDYSLSGYQASVTDEEVKPVNNASLISMSDKRPSPCGTYQCAVRDISIRGEAEHEP